MTTLINYINDTLVVKSYEHPTFVQRGLESIVYKYSFNSKVGNREFWGWLLHYRNRYIKESVCYD